MAEVLALVDDLFFQAKLRETAKQLGVDLEICGTARALHDANSREAPRLVIVDLNARDEPLQAIVQLRSSATRVPIISYLSHMQLELAEKARAAGCEVVMARSKFTRELATILAQAKSQSA